jgi:serine/threonine-protein kinase RsbW
MRDAGYAEGERFAVQLSLEEAIINANKHAHQGDWQRPIVVRHRVNEQRVVTQVQDQGTGFEPNEVPDPLDLENLDRTSGRGLFLMQSLMSRVCHNAEGNCVCLCSFCDDDYAERHRLRTNEPRSENTVDAELLEHGDETKAREDKGGEL